jgi:hypothetical protein
MYDKEQLGIEMEDADRIPAQQIKIKISKNKYALIDIKEGGLLKFSDVISFKVKGKAEEKYQEVRLLTKAEKIVIKKEEK